MKPFALLYLCLACLPSLTWAQEKTPSKMAAVLADSRLSLACQAKVSAIADHIIGKKKHRILEKQVSDSDSFHVFVLLSYNDQDSHLSLTASPTKTDCRVDSSESFELPAPCTEARESIFKRWEMLGRLSEKTRVLRYDHPRKKTERLADENARALGFLTQTRRGAGCLITRQQQNIPLPVTEE